MIPDRVLFDQLGVVGVGGITELSATKVANVYVEDITAMAALPKRWGDVVLNKVVAGHVIALSTMMAPQVALGRSDRFRPVPGGVSLGHPSITSGSSGGMVGRYGISNNHVVSAGTSLQVERARVGDPVLQPGPHYGGRYPEDVVGTIPRLFPFDEVGVNIVDMGIYEEASLGILSRELLELGVPSDRAIRPEVGLKVLKSGATSGVNQGNVIDESASFKVDYGFAQLTFSDVFVTTHMADPGDSGSRTVSNALLTAGLVFAGSEMLTLHINWSRILEALGIGPPPPPTGIPGIAPYVMGGLLGLGFLAAV